MKVGVFIILLSMFQNCGRKLETGNTSTQTNQTTTSVPDSPAERYPIPQPNPSGDNSPNTQTPQPNPIPNPTPSPLPTPSPQNVQNPTPSQAGDTNIQIAAQYPTDSHFANVRWAGVFDSRVTGTAQYSPASWADVSAVGQGRCITNDMIHVAGDGSTYAAIYWYFTNNRFDGNEALQTLRISPGESVVYKVILPPGTSESTVSDQAGLWGNVWTQSTTRNAVPVSTNWQSYGGFNPLVSYSGRASNAAFVITQPLSQETYGILWFQHRGEGDNRVIAVKELIINITIKDINQYNQWFSRTTGINCP